MPTNTKLRAVLARRIRIASPSEWRDFSQLWIAFNAIYGGECDKNERARVMACIRKNFSEQSALRVLRAVTHSTDLILAIPPGNMLLNRADPNFRAATQRCAALYRNIGESAVGRLAAVGGVIYQIRCNLIHGDKDPDDSRDQMLIRESLLILNALVPTLEDKLI